MDRKSFIKSLGLLVGGMFVGGKAVDENMPTGKDDKDDLYYAKRNIKGKLESTKRPNVIISDDKKYTMRGIIEYFPSDFEKLEITN